LVVDADTVLALPVAAQCFETVAGQGRQVLQRYDRLKAIKLQLRGPLESRERLDSFPGGETLWSVCPGS
jgi:hypothetical protein